MLHHNSPQFTGLLSLYPSAGASALPHLVIHRAPRAFHAMPGRSAAALQGTAQRNQGVGVDPAGTGRYLRSQPAEAGPSGRQDPVVDGLPAVLGEVPNHGYPN